MIIGIRWESVVINIIYEIKYYDIINKFCNK